MAAGSLAAMMVLSKQSSPAPQFPQFPWLSSSSTSLQLQLQLGRPLPVVPVPVPVPVTVPHSFASSASLLRSQQLADGSLHGKRLLHT